MLFYYSGEVGCEAFLVDEETETIVQSSVSSNSKIENDYDEDEDVRGLYAEQTLQHGLRSDIGGNRDIEQLKFSIERMENFLNSLSDEVRGMKTILLELETKSKNKLP